MSNGYGRFGQAQCFGKKGLNLLIGLTIYGRGSNFKFEHAAYLGVIFFPPEDFIFAGTGGNF